MPESKSGGIACHLDLNFFRFIDGGTSYEPQGGLRGRYLFLGYIDDPYRTPFGDIDELGGRGDSPFHHKPVSLEIQTPVNLEDQERIASRLNVNKACGAVKVTAGAEQIEVITQVPQDAFDVIRRQAAEAYDRHHVMAARISLLDGISLDEVSLLGELVDKPSWTLPKELDVSQTRQYALGDFRISNTGDIDDMRDRVQEIRPERHEDYGTSINVEITEAEWHADPETGAFTEILCEGRLQNFLGVFESADVSICFLEHEINYEKLNDKRLFGEFYYREIAFDNKEIREMDTQERVRIHERNGTYFRPLLEITLCYMPEDAKNLIIPLLAQCDEGGVMIEINFMNTNEELRAADDGFEGKIRDYRIEVHKKNLKLKDIYDKCDEISIKQSDMLDNQTDTQDLINYKLLDVEQNINDINDILGHRPEGKSVGYALSYTLSRLNVIEKLIKETTWIIILLLGVIIFGGLVFI